MVEAFTKYISEIEGIDFDKDHEILFFRGVSNASYDLAPGILFAKNVSESSSYHSLLLEYPEEFNTKDHLGTLAKMQHYGLPTRLLDVTTNVLMAAFFACEQNSNIDGKVTVFKVNKDEILHHNSDRALMLSCLPPLKEDVKDDIRFFCENNTGKITEQRILGHPEMTKFLHEIRGEYPAFETAIVGSDILNCFFVQANKSNVRMKTQDGYFVIFGLDYNKGKQYLKRKTEKEIVISANEKQNMLKTLELMGVRSDTVYPDLERTALYLRSKKLGWKDLTE